ncbi:MAG: murein hydrolase activator EnvC family protein [Lachnospirales bacterium]
MKKNILVFVALLTSIFVANAYGSTISELEKKQKAIEAQLKVNNEELSKILSQKKGIEAEIVESDIILGEITAQLDIINLNLENVNAELTKTEAELTNAEIERDNQQVILEDRLRNMYEFGEVTYLDALLDINNFEDIVNRVEYIKYVNDYDQELYNNFIAIVEEIEIKKEEIITQKSEIETLKLEEEIKKQEIETEIKNKVSLVLSLDTAASAEEAEIQALEVTSDELEESIQAEIKKQEEANRAKLSQVVYGGGKLGWPVPSSSRITSRYGPRVHPITGEVGKVHAGLDIAASTGTPVVAAEDGIVTSSGYLGGYGYAVIIYHGDGISTLYAHNSALTVSEGQKVTKGQQISKAGSTGNSTGPHCHFEVRINGRHTNPLPYLQ